MFRRLMLISTTVVGAGLFLAACNGGYGTPSAPSRTEPAPAGSTTVTIVTGSSTLTNTAFAPNPLTVSIGTTVSWLNNDNATHTSSANDGAWGSSSLAPGSRFNFTFNSAGTFEYHCSIHPNMVGTVVVQ